MKILVFNTAASETGALKILKDFFEFVCNNDNQNKWTFVVSIEELIGTDRVKVIVNKKTKKNRLERIKFELFETKRIIREEKPDVILSLQNLTVLWTNIPQIIYFHQSLPYNNYKKYSIFNNAERNFKIYLFVLKILFKWSFRKSKKIIVQTRWLKDVIIKKERINSKKIIVIPPAYTFNRILNIKKRNFKTQSIFFYPTAPFEHKNISNLIEAFKLILDKQKNIKLYITIDGAENSYSAMIKEQISDYKNNIILIGRIPFAEVQKYYEKSVLIFPSYLESFGLPLLEARSAGIDILVSELPFAEEILYDYTNAWFFNPFDIYSIYSTIDKYLMFKVNNVNKMVKSNEKKIFLEKYSPENTWGKIVNLVETTGAK